MEDAQIVALYWQRKESAIHETRKKHERYLLRRACGILAGARGCLFSVGLFSARSASCIFTAEAL